MKGFIVFSSLMAGFIISLTLATTQAGTLPVMESHGSLKISSTAQSQFVSSRVETSNDKVAYKDVKGYSQTLPSQDKDRMEDESDEKHITQRKHHDQDKD